MCWDQWSREMSFTRRPGSGRPRQTSCQKDHHIVRNACGQSTPSSVAIQEQRHKSRFNLSSDDNRVRVWRPRGELLNPAFALQRHTTSTAGVMVWGAIAYNTRSPLVLIHGTITVQRYVHDILQPHALSLMQRLPGAIFQKENARPHTARVSQDWLCTVTTLPWSARSTDLSQFEHIWDYLGQEVVHPTSLN
ncbi:transposable element Tcb2 transposase [Trichonephila clavipes]|nr:transposable element Tcb2 transposase [Trichonephila clavipes]